MFCRVPLESLQTGVKDVESCYEVFGTLRKLLPIHLGTEIT